MIQDETRLMQPDSDVEQHPSHHCGKATSVANTNYDIIKSFIFLSTGVKLSLIDWLVLIDNSCTCISYFSSTLGDMLQEYDQCYQPSFYATAPQLKYDYSFDEPFGISIAFVLALKFLTSCRTARSSMTSSEPPGILVPGTSRYIPKS